MARLSEEAEIDGCVAQPGNFRVEVCRETGGSGSPGWALVHRSSSLRQLCSARPRATSRFQRRAHLLTSVQHREIAK